MKTARFISVVAGSVTLLLAVSAQSATVPQCPFTPDYLKSELGQNFAAGVPEAGIIGKACTYKANGIKVWIDTGPLPVANSEMWRKMSAAPGTKWIAVSGDADKAVHEVPPTGVSPYPALSYERSGWLVNIVVTGVEGKTQIESWNAKLRKLRRIP
ncbi:hypothetical protein [Undibacterium danionis]|uniref:Uncharacterized protein n=1 Tax=Undibacterium danionis TaxID=1812100 RepID=A0ABV6IDB1_9BURK